MNVEDLVYVTGPFLFPFFFGILSQMICKGMELLDYYFPLQPVNEPAPAAWKSRVMSSSCHLDKVSNEKFSVNVCFDFFSADMKIRSESITNHWKWYLLSKCKLIRSWMGPKL